MTRMTPARGAAPERTALAWQRTAISLLVGAAIVARLTYRWVGPLGLVLVVAAMAACIWVLGHTRTLVSRNHHGDGVRHIAITAAMLALAVTELAAIALRD